MISLPSSKKCDVSCVPAGTFICSTYGKHHMQEISALVQDFDARIVLSAEKLYDRFGLSGWCQSPAAIFFLRFQAHV